MNSDHQTIADRLSELAHEAGNVSALARICSMHQRTMAGWVAGDREPKISDAAKIASRMGVRLEWLATGAEPKRISEVAPTGAHPQLSDDIKSNQPLPLLPELLKATILGMEMAINRAGATLSANSRALAILTLYDISYRRYMTRKAGGEPVDLEKDIDAAALSPDGMALLKLIKEKDRDQF